jgi:hypothetical protein
VLRPSTPRLREHKALLAFTGLEPARLREHKALLTCTGLEPEFTVKQLNAMQNSELSLRLKLTPRQSTAVGYIAEA